MNDTPENFGSLTQLFVNRTVIEIITSSEFQCQSCYESIKLENSEPANDGCWANEFNGEFTECTDGCFKTIKVEYEKTRSDDPIYTWAVQRGCQGASQILDLKNYFGSNNS